MSDHDRQYVIDLDGNCSLDVLAEKLTKKLDTYSFRRAVVPQLLKESEEEDLPEEVEPVCVIIIVSKIIKRFLWACFC